MKIILQKKLITISVHLIIALSIYCSGTSISMDGERDRWQPRPDYPLDDDRRVEYQVYGSSPEQQIQKAKGLLSYNNFDEAKASLAKTRMQNSGLHWRIAKAQVKSGILVELLEWIKSVDYNYDCAYAYLGAAEGLIEKEEH